MSADIFGSVCCLRDIGGMDNGTAVPRALQKNLNGILTETKLQFGIPDNNKYNNAQHSSTT